MNDNDSSQPHCDAIVIGAGAGGLSAAARLVAAGKKVLVVESRDRLGGRASSERIEGFTVNVGAIAIELGGLFEETFAALGVPLDLREPKPATVFYIDGKIIDPAKGGWGMLLGGFTKQAAKIGAKFADARAGDLPEGNLSTQEWLAGYTKNETVHAIFRNLCAAIFAANADELPARAFLTYFTAKGAFKRFGFCPRGTVGLWNDLADGSTTTAARSGSDDSSEIEAALQDLRDAFPGFAEAKMLSIRVMRGDWPAQRSCSGHDMPQDTPLANLWHVGDAVKAYGDGGTQACADTGRVAAQRAVAWLAGATVAA